MTEKPSLLIVYNYNRYDFLHYFHACKNDFNFYFAEFVSPKEEQNQEYRTFGKAIYWGDFQNVFQLLSTIQPQKVLFHYIESNFHVLLNVACKVKGIPTYIIDHGLRDININIRLKEHLTPTRKQDPFNKFRKKILTLIPRIKARRYLLNSLKKLPYPIATDVKLYFSKRESFTPDFLAIPTAFITISAHTFNYYRKIYGLSESYKHFFIGIPIFDKLASIKPGSINPKSILFIDQGLDKVGVFGWNTVAHNNFFINFLTICDRLGYHVFMKPHPRKAIGITNMTGGITIVNDKDIARLIPYTKIIIGFTSTYLLPLAALPHTVVLTLENHPAGRLDVSKSFVEAGVAHPVYSLNELPWALEHAEELHRQQLPHKKQFEKDWLYKFDGKSGERLRTILLSNDL